MLKKEKSLLQGRTAALHLSDENGALTGSVLGLQGAALSKKIQKEYMEHQPHQIPLLFMMDVIHGMKTIFPAPLAQAATFEPELTKEGSEIAAKRQQLQVSMWLFLLWQTWCGIPDGEEWWNRSERIRISVTVL